MQTATADAKAKDAAGLLAAAEHEVEEAERRVEEARQRADAARARGLEARCAPLRERAGQIEDALAAIDAKVDALLHDAVKRARVLYSEHVALHNQRCESELEVAKIVGQVRETFPPVPFEGFLVGRVKHFHYLDVTRDGPAWAREGD